MTSADDASKSLDEAIAAGDDVIAQCGAGGDAKLAAAAKDAAVNNAAGGAGGLDKCNTARLGVVSNLKATQQAVNDLQGKAYALL